MMSKMPRLSNAEVSKSETVQKVKEEGEEEDYSDYSDGEDEDALTNDAKEESNLSTEKSASRPSSQVDKSLDVLMKELCQEAPVSEDVSNKCVYKCSQCNESFMAWTALKTHFRTAHSELHLSVREIEKVMTRIICHVCKICSALLFCDIHLVGRHLYTHNTTVNKYFQDFEQTATYSNNVIGNLCEFECTECNKKFSCKDTLYQHQRHSLHRSNIKANQSVTRKVYHLCKMCNKSILCDSNTLKKHLFRSHGLSLKGYCRKTGCSMVQSRHSASSWTIKKLPLSKDIGNFCLFSCNVCSKKFSNSACLREHFIVKHQPKVVEPLPTYLIKGFSYRCKVCSKLMLCDNYVMQSHMSVVHGFKKDDKRSVTFKLKEQYKTFCDSFIKDIPVSPVIGKRTIVPIEKIPIKNITSKIGSFCCFRCPRCDLKDVSNYKSLRAHFKAVHNCGVTYKPSLVSVARYHGCLLCPKAVLSDRQFLGTHISTMHKKSLVEYERTFLRNGGESLPTYTDWKRSELQDLST